MPRPTSRSIAATDRAEGHATPSVGGKSVIQWLRRGALAASLACAVLVTGPAFAAKKAPPIAEPMYLSDYANMVTRNFGGAIKPLTHLVGADPTMAGFRNALALALFTAHPEEHEAALQHAKKAMALKPKVPQFVVTYILTDRSQWKVEADGTARLTRTAALQLAEVTEKLLDMSGNAKKLGRLLDSLEETGGDPDFPFVLVDYKKLIAKPSLVLTRPDADEFAIAQKAIVERISNLKKKLNADKKVAEENTREAVERKDEIDQQVAEATALQEERNAAKARAMAKLQETAIEAAASSKRVAELERQRQLAAEVEERRAAGEIQIAAAEQATRDIRLAKEAAAAAAFEEVQRLAEQARIDADILLGLAAAAEDDLAARPSHHDEFDGEHDHDEFDSFILSLGPVADPEALETRLVAAIEAHDILRIKGFVDVPGKRRRHVIQAVGSRIGRYFDRDWHADEARQSRLVVIGLSPLDRGAISTALGGV